MPFDELWKILEGHCSTASGRAKDGDSIPFIGGAVGYFAYDLCHFIERLPDTTIDDIRFPDMYFAFYTKIVAIDHLTGRSYVAVSDFTGRGQTELQREADEYVAGIAAAGRLPFKQTNVIKKATEVESNFTREEYLEAIQRAKDYIFAGDIFQANISQRFHAQIHSSHAALYTRLREIHPAPFACYLSFDDKAVVSSSPERFLRIQNAHVETRPIKGTRPRGKNKREDEKMKAELLASKKDEAELTMIVDLERNDLGRVCDYGTVKVTEKKVIEEYPTVYHLVATVEGDLHARYNTIDLLKATFPGGSITGAPKIRAMEIIDELEPTKRSVYTGAIGYFSFNGNVDLNIAIRTFLVSGADAYFQAGGGIVADSQLESEYDETLDKARALMESVRT